MSQAIPDELCIFIAHALNPVGIHPTYIQTLRSRLVYGLATLCVDQLKKTACALRRFRLFQTASIRSPSNLRKQELIDWILRPFYLDFPNCKQPNREALQELEQYVNDSTSANSSSSSNSTPSTMPSAAPAQHTASVSRKQTASASRNGASAATTAAAVAIAPRPFSPNPVQYHQNFPVPYPLHPMMAYAACGRFPAFPVAGMPMMQFPPQYTTTTPPPGNRASLLQTPKSSLQTPKSSLQANKSSLQANKSSLQANKSSFRPDSAVRVKRERSDSVTSATTTTSESALSGMSRYNDDLASSATPQNGLEASLLSQLLGMGFTDQSEILSSIRRLRSRATPATSLTADQVMLDIITQREEKEEARQMDEARLLSERARKEESARLRKRGTEQLNQTQRQASWDDWLGQYNMFPNSWLLRQTVVRTALEPVWKAGKNPRIKHKFVELIKLEKKAYKWYTNNLPRSYFINVLAKKLIVAVNKGGAFLEQVLDAELKQLEIHMYTLSEQQGGVPRLFLDAHDEALAANDNASARDDDDVVVVVSLGPVTAKENKVPISTLNQRKRPKLEVAGRGVDANANDVIEIL